MPVELRCDGMLYGILSDDGTTVEVKCKRRKCGAQPGTVVLHTIDLTTGKVIATRRFAEPHPRKE